MSQLDERISQAQKMANDDPENELGHYRLGQLLMEAQRYDEAIGAFNRTLELSPMFSKVYELLGRAQIESGKRDEAVKTLRKGFEVADERGDNKPREEMVKLLQELGETPPEPKKKAAAPQAGAGDFQCRRPMCFYGSRARQLSAPPLNDELGRRIYENICEDCWNEWLRNYGVKVINEFRLDLSSEQGAAEYDRYMCEFLGLEQPS
jgi:tetratricopeptide (TPR) repeat protein